jgi:pyrroloquinoline-quinone synthase
VDLWTRLEAARARWNVLEHPFYQRWSAGTLSRSDLAIYAGQYRHAVVALASASRAAADAATGDEARALEEHAREESAHVELWDGFARAMGADLDAPASPETRDCARAWSRPGRDLLGTLVALYAIESAQPAIADTKRVGLRERYGVADAEAVAYFDVHVERDREHAAAERALIEPRIDEDEVERLVAEAEGALRANWELLEGVERLASHPATEMTDPG